MSRRNVFTNAPIHLSILIASLMSSGCGTLKMSYDKIREQVALPGSQSEQVQQQEISPIPMDKMDQTQKSDPKTILMDAANIAIEQGKHAEAMNYWAQLTSQYPDDIDGYLGYAKSGRKLRAHQRVLSKLYDYKMRNPHNTEIISEIAKVHYELKDYHQALEEIDSAIELDGSNWKHYSLRGVISNKLNYPFEAEASYGKALELSPNNPTVLNNLAASKIANGQYDDAEFFITKAIDHPEASMQVYRTYAKILTLKGDRAQAEAFLQAKLGNQSDVNMIVNSVKTQVSRPVMWGRR